MHVLITGGTSGIGRALARHYAGLGHDVTAVGRTDRGDGVRFVRADLSLVSENARLAAEVGDVDLLVLCAAAFSPTRVETADGLERTFALGYLSRYLLSHRIAAPLTVNVAGPGVNAGRIHWDDLQLRARYSLGRATMQASRANDLLGASLAGRDGTRYVLWNPGPVDTGMHRQLAAPWRQLAAPAFRLAAARPENAAGRIAALAENPPAAPLAAYRYGKPLDLRRGFLATHFDASTADRLHKATEHMLATVA